MFLNADIVHAHCMLRSLIRSTGGLVIRHAGSTVGYSPDRRDW